MDGFKTSKRSDKDEIYKLFSNVMCVRPPKVCVFPDLMQKILFDMDGTHEFGAMSPAK